jgi:hypothetical protein
MQGAGLVRLATVHGTMSLLADSPMFRFPMEHGSYSDGMYYNTDKAKERHEQSYFCVKKLKAQGFEVIDGPKPIKSVKAVNATLG